VFECNPKSLTPSTFHQRRRVFLSILRKTHPSSSDIIIDNNIIGPKANVSRFAQKITPSSSQGIPVWKKRIDHTHTARDPLERRENNNDLVYFERRLPTSIPINQISTPNHETVFFVHPIGGCIHFMDILAITNITIRRFYLSHDIYSIPVHHEG
jgi:hypothetical protein